MFQADKSYCASGHRNECKLPRSEVGGNTETHPLIVAAIFGAMVECVPNRVMASEGTTRMAVLSLGVMIITLMNLLVDLILVMWGMEVVRLLMVMMRQTRLTEIVLTLPWKYLKQGSHGL